MRRLATFAAVLVLGAIVITCSAMSLLLSWAAWPLDTLKTICMERAQRLARAPHSTHRSSP